MTESKTILTLKQSELSVRYELTPQQSILICDMLNAMEAKKTPTVAANMDVIIGQVSDYLQIHVWKIKKKDRKKEIIYARHMSIYLALKFARLTSKAVGKYFGQDYSTVLHARQSIQDRFDTEASVRDDVSGLLSVLGISIPLPSTN